MKGSILVFGITMMMLAETAFTQGARNLPPRPTLTGPLADLVNQIINAINKQDKTFVEKLLAPNATWADEDGHIFPATFFTNKLMQGMPRKLTATNIAGETWGDAAWAAFDYTLDETLRDGTPNQIKGTETLMFRKAGNDWQVVLVHAAIDAKAITPH
jgi:ketosteroid isomerase-like protein